MLLAWWNLIYMVPFGLALVYLGLFVFTGITFGDADMDADADVDGDVEGELHIEAHVVDADADHDVETDHHAGSQLAVHGPAMTGHPLDAHEGEPSLVSSFFSFLGMGKIPLSLALMIFLLCWGSCGFALNSLLFRTMGDTSVIGIISLPITLLVTLGLTGLCAAIIGKLLPNNTGARDRKQDLVGKAGEAIYDIDSNFGMASVRGHAGDLFQINCRTPEGKPRIAKGSRIVLYDYDREKGVFHVAPFDA